MEPNTIRLPGEEWESLSDEAEEMGYRNRSEYLRDIIENRQVIFENTSDYEFAKRDVLRKRIETLEQMVDDGAATPDDGAEARDTTVRDYDENTTEHEENTTEYTNDDRPSIEEVIEGWTPKRKREERREAGRQALEFLRGRGRAEKKHFLGAVDHTVPEQNEDTFWRKSIRPALQKAMDVGLVKHERGPPHEYVWADE